MAGKDNTRDCTRDGAAAETVAASHLEAHGMRIIARNHRCKGGEIDLVCRDREALVFVEVRLRRNTSFGGAGESITAAKRARLVIAARHWLGTHPDDTARPCRFDCVLFDGGDKRPQWIRDAFVAE